MPPADIAEKKARVEALLEEAIATLDEIGYKLAATHVVHGLDLLRNGVPVTRAEVG